MGLDDSDATNDEELWAVLPRLCSMLWLDVRRHEMGHSWWGRRGVPIDEGESWAHSDDRVDVVLDAMLEVMSRYCFRKNDCWDHAELLAWMVLPVWSTSWNK